MSARASFVIPAYNAERWLSKAIYSCRQQSVKTVEIIVVNDGSTDDTRAIVDFHAQDPRVIPVHLDANVGRSEARNIGNEKASAPYILVLDADDMATPNRAKETLNAFDAKKADLVYGSFWVIDSLGNTVRKILSSPFDPALSKERKLNFICHSTVAYTKKLAADVRYDGGEYSRLGLDDWKLQWDAYKKGYSIKNVRSPLAYYRVSEGTVSSTRNEDEVSKVKEQFLASV